MVSARGVVIPCSDIALVVADTVFDSLQAWDDDAAGFNVHAELSTALSSPFTEWGTEYLVAVTLELTDGVVDGFAWVARTPG